MEKALEFEALMWVIHTRDSKATCVTGRSGRSILTKIFFEKTS